MAHTDEIWAPSTPTDGLDGPPPLPHQSDFSPGDQRNVAIASEVAGDITRELKKFTDASGVRYAALYSETGARIAHAGPDEAFLGRADEIPALAVGAFFATRELAGRLGETGFEGLYQQGAQRHLYLAPAGESFLMLSVFSAPTNVGIVRICAAETTGGLLKLIASGMGESGKNSRMATASTESESEPVRPPGPVAPAAPASNPNAFDWAEQNPAPTPHPLGPPAPVAAGPATPPTAPAPAPVAVRPAPAPAPGSPPSASPFFSPPADSPATAFPPADPPPNPFSPPPAPQPGSATLPAPQPAASGFPPPLPPPLPTRNINGTAPPAESAPPAHAAARSLARPAPTGPLASGPSPHSTSMWMFPDEPASQAPSIAPSIASFETADLHSQPTQNAQE